MMEVKPETVLAELAKRSHTPEAQAKMREAAPDAQEERPAFAPGDEEGEPALAPPPVSAPDAAPPEMAPPPSAQPTVTPAPASTADGDGENPIFAVISATYRQLRRGLAALGILLPIALLLGGGLDNIQGSMSAYYHFDDGRMRDVFVGANCAVGVLLVFYRGYTQVENWALNFAGLAAVMIALFPMAWPEGSAQTTTSVIHYTSATIFFLLISYVAAFRSSDTLDLMDDEQRRKKFRRSYRLIGVLMLTLPVAIGMLDVLGLAGDGKSYVILVVEVVGIAIFGAFWIVKSREIAILEEQ